MARLGTAPPASSSAGSGATPVEVPGGRIDVTIDRKSDAPPDALLLAWVTKAGRAVAAYYGTFPVDRVALTIHAGGPGKISGGRTNGEGGQARIRIFAGVETTEKDLASNWELVHEMVHLAFPSMTDRHEWLEEGLATYVEPLARARAHLAPQDDIWKWLLWGLPMGLDGIETQGLDRARGRNATYWGGALFCFLADVEIRQRTNNTKSLDDALRGIVKAGGDVRVSWPIERALKTGDAAVGVSVLEELYAKMSNSPVQVGLPELFKRLGVSVTKSGAVDVAKDTVTYDDNAPLAAIRKGITAGR